MDRNKKLGKKPFYHYLNLPKWMWIVLCIGQAITIWRQDASLHKCKDLLVRGMEIAQELKDLADKCQGKNSAL